MSNPPLPPVSTHRSAPPPFGPIDPLIAALRLDAVGHTLDEVDALVMSGKPPAARELIREARVVLTELSRVHRQEHDRVQQQESLVREARGDAAVMADIANSRVNSAAGLTRARGLTPTGALPPMPPLGGYDVIYEEWKAERAAGRSVLPRRRFLSVGQAVFVGLVVGFVVLVAAVGAHL